MIENQESLLRAIINAFLFLENSGDEVNPDSAVKAMEGIAYPLLTLTDKHQVEATGCAKRHRGHRNR